MDSLRILRRWLVCLAAVGAVSMLMPAAPAAAVSAVATGKLTMLVPSGPIRFNGSFTMTIDFANTETGAIEDPDIALYLQAKDLGGLAQPLLPENVTITAPGIPVQKWNTGAGTQVGVKFSPDLHSNLAPGAHNTYVFTVAVAMPPGTASLALGARAWKSGSPTLIYDQKQAQLSVNAPASSPPPAAATSSPPALPSPTPTSSSPTPSPTAAEPTPAENEPTSAAPIDAVAVAEPSSTGLAWWIWLALLMIASSAGVLVWLVLRWRQDRDALEE